MSNGLKAWHGLSCSPWHVAPRVCLQNIARDLDLASNYFSSNLSPLSGLLSKLLQRNNKLHSYGLSHTA